MQQAVKMMSIVVDSNATTSTSAFRPFHFADKTIVATVALTNSHDSAPGWEGTKMTDHHMGVVPSSPKSSGTKQHSFEADGPPTAVQRRIRAASLWDAAAVKRLESTLQSRRETREAHERSMRETIQDHKLEIQRLEESELPSAIEAWQSEYEALLSTLKTASHSREMPWLEPWLMVGGSSEGAENVARSNNSCDSSTHLPSVEALVKGSPSRACRLLLPVLDRCDELQRGVTMMREVERLKRDVAFEKERGHLQMSRLEQQLSAEKQQIAVDRDRLGVEVRRWNAIHAEVDASSSALQRQVQASCDDPPVDSVTVVDDASLALLRQRTEHWVTAQNSEIAEIVLRCNALSARKEEAMIKASEFELACHQVSVEHHEQLCRHFLEKQWRCVAVNEPRDRLRLVQAFEDGIAVIEQHWTASSSALIESMWKREAEAKHAAIDEIERKLVTAGVRLHHASEGAVAELVIAAREERKTLQRLLGDANSALESLDTRLAEVQDACRDQVLALSPLSRDEAQLLCGAARDACDERHKTIESLSAEMEERNDIARILSNGNTDAGAERLSVAEVIAKLRERRSDDCANATSVLERYQTLHRQITFLSSELARVQEEASHHVEYSVLGTFRTLSSDLERDRTVLDGLRASLRDEQESLAALSLSAESVEGFRRKMEAEARTMEDTIGELRSSVRQIEDRKLAAEESLMHAETRRLEVIDSIQKAKQRQQGRFVKRMTLLERRNRTSLAVNPQTAPPTTVITIPPPPPPSEGPLTTKPTTWRQRLRRFWW